MSKKSNKSARRKKNKGGFPAADTTSQAPQTSGNTAGAKKESPRWYLIAVFFAIAIGGTYLTQAARNVNVDLKRYSYKLIEKYKHDPDAFTQGLVLENGIVWESTGKYDGESSIRKVDLKSGEILKQVQLPDDQFGEGLAMVGDELFQLTWKKGICHVYDKELNKVKEFDYDGQGWGLTYDGNENELIMSDGTSRLYFLDPKTFKEIRSVTVRNGRSPVDSLNELEYTGGKLYANRWRWDSIYQIDPETGKVLAVIDLTKIWKRSERPADGVLNGIAVDNDGTIIVTGKYCPHIYEIKLQDPR